MTRPTLLLFRAVRPGVSDFLREHVSEQERCLQQDFDVHTVNAAADYDELCDRLRPDVAMFECGVDSAPFAVSNTHTHPEVPKVGFLHCDAYDNARSTFLAYMEQWGISTYFTHSVAMGEYFPELTNSLFCWPNFIDPAVFHPLQVAKAIPVLITGSQVPLYPWRNRVTPQLLGTLPAFLHPHPRWRSGGRQDPLRYIGTDYARLLATSQVVLTCGSMTKDVVRKHFEIPAVGACLVTEDTASVRAAGFADQENCIFADADDVVEKVSDLFTDPDLLAKITAAGHDLVHVRHTIDQRRQVAQWLRAHRAQTPGTTIMQAGPFSDVTLASDVTREGCRPIISGGVDRPLVASGWARLAAGRASAAEALFRRALNLFYVPEAVVGITWALLHSGAPDVAHGHIRRILDQSLIDYRAPAPDPVQWATLVRVQLCSGNLDAARRTAKEYPEVQHCELRRIRALLGLVDDVMVSDRLSIVPLPERSDRGWLDELADMLVACRQHDLAARVRGVNDLGRPAQLDGVAVMSLPVRRRVGRQLERVERLWWRLPPSVIAKVKQRYYVSNRYQAVLEGVARRPGSALYLAGATRTDRWAIALRREASRSAYLRKVVVVRQLPDGADLTDAFVYLTRGALAVHDPERLFVSQLVILNGTNDSAGYELLSALHTSGKFRLADADPEGRGLAILKAVHPPDYAALSGVDDVPADPRPVDSADANATDRPFSAHSEENEDSHD